MKILRQFLPLSIVVLCAAAFAAGSQGGAQGQRPGPPGTIRVRVSLVPVDVIVTDQNDRPITDLKQEEFQIFEDGRRQDIRHFSIQALAATAPEPDQRPTMRAAPALELAPQSSRTFLILMGRGRQQVFKSVDTMIRLVRNDLLPQDRVAVFAYDRATNFTTNHEQVAQVLERYKKMHEGIESKLESRFGGLAAIYGSKGMPKSIQPDIDRIFADSAGLESRQVPPGSVTDSRTMGKDARAVAEGALRDSEAAKISPFSSLEADAVTDLPFSEYASTFASTSQDVQNIFTCIEYLRYMEGEKHLIFFTERGLFLPRLEQDNSIAAVANDARVAIDTFQTGGISVTGGFSGGFAMSSLRNISTQTGGRSSIYQYVNKTLASVNQTSKVEYLLGYYPTNENWNGKYRHITVRVSRPGLKVSFRHGYYAQDKIQVFDRAEYLAYSRITAAAAYVPDLKDLPFKISTSATNGTQPQINVDLQIDATQVGMRSVNSLHAGELRITIFYADDKGRYLGDAWKTATLNLSEETYQRYLQFGLPISIPIPHTAPKQILKVVIYDTVNDKVGTRLFKAYK
jgi:VWFA-related protein